jgi:hypothetical protein
MSVKLFRYDYDVRDKMRNRIQTSNLFVWLPVHDSGEVDMGGIREFDDELHDLCEGWEWKKFRLIPEVEAVK